MKRIAVLLLTLAALTGCTSWETSRAPGETVRKISKPVPFEFGMSGIIRLTVDLTVDPPVLLVPSCFGPITRVAVVSADLRSTYWEIVAAPTGVAPPLAVRLGTAPSGFRTSQAASVGVAVLRVGIVVVNGPRQLGMSVLSRSTLPHAATPSTNAIGNSSCPPRA